MFASQSFTYTIDGRLETMSDDGGQELEYSYDAEGNITGSVQDQDGDTLSDEFETVIIEADPNDAFETFADVTPEQDFDGDGDDNGTEFANMTFPADNLIPAVGLPALALLVAALVGFLRFHNSRKNA